MMLFASAAIPSIWVALGDVVLSQTEPAVVGTAPPSQLPAVPQSLEVDPFPAIVFATAYDEYAIRAFEVNAVDYLLKPVERDRLVRALSRVAERLRAMDAEQRADDPHLGEARERTRRPVAHRATVPSKEVRVCARALRLDRRLGDERQRFSE